MCLSNDFFDHKGIYNYTKVGVVRDDIEVKSMIDFELVKKKKPKCLMDVKSVKRVEYRNIISLCYLM